MVSIEKAKTDKDLLEILELQKSNVKAVLEGCEVASEGFVTVEHNLDLLREMNAPHPHTIAKHDNKVVGYALSMLPSMGEQIPILRALNAHVLELGILTHEYIIMGQICIDKNFRKQGIFRQLYSAMAMHLKDHFKYIITEVAIENQRSLNAHKATGFKVLQLREDTKKGEHWAIVCLNLESE